MEMFTVKKVSEVMDLLNKNFMDCELNSEEVELVDSVGRIVVEDIVSYENIPSFRRSTVDGYGVRAKNTIGCSDTIPVFLNFLGEVQMGKFSNYVVGDYDAVYVPTGGMVPEGADSVVMIEDTEDFDTEISVNKPVRPLENIIGIGDDIKSTQVILEKHTRVKSNHIGVLAAVGKSRLTVYKIPKIGILSTGDEIVDICDDIKLGQMRDVNSYSLSAMVKELGCDIAYIKKIKDQKDLIKDAIKDAINLCDIVLISGGSSVGTKDMTPEIINSLGKPGVMVHGVAIKPGKPTIVAKIGDKAIFGLPGHPASCIIAYKAIVEPFISETIMKTKTSRKYITAKSNFQIHVSSGRDVYYMVSLEETQNGFIINPIHGKSGMATLLSQAEGYIVIPMENEGVNVGDEVKVHLF